MAAQKLTRKSRKCVLEVGRIEPVPLIYLYRLSDKLVSFWHVSIVALTTVCQRPALVQ